MFKLKVEIFHSFVKFSKGRVEGFSMNKSMGIPCLFHFHGMSIVFFFNGMAKYGNDVLITGPLRLLFKWDHTKIHDAFFESHH